MPDTTVRDDAAVESERAPAGAPPSGSRTLFSSHYAGVGPSARQASLERILSSVGVHLVGLLAVVALIKYTPAGNFVSQPMDAIPFKDIVFLPAPGPGGGGGGGAWRTATWCRVMA